MRKPAARGGRCGGLSQVAHRGAARPGTRPRFASPSARDGIRHAAGRQWAGRPIFATQADHRRSAEKAEGPVRAPYHLVRPGMTITIESVAVVLAALAVGLLLGLFARTRRRFFEDTATTE